MFVIRLKNNIYAVQTIMCGEVNMQDIRHNINNSAEILVE